MHYRIKTERRRKKACGNINPFRNALLLKPVRECRTEGALDLIFKSVAAPCTPDDAEYIVCIMVIHS